MGICDIFRSRRSIKSRTKLSRHAGLAIETMEQRMLLSGYTWTSAASGAWLEMQASGSDVTKVLVTNVCKFELDGSGSAVALEDGGDLVRFAPNSTERQQIDAGVSNFVVDASGSVVAFQPTLGSNVGTLVRFVPGTYTQHPIAGTFKAFAEDGKGNVVALDTSGNLTLYEPGWTHKMATGVSTFLVDSAGSVVAFQPTPRSNYGTLVRFVPGTNTQEPFARKFQSFAEDGKGDVVALDITDKLWFYAPSSINAQPMTVGVSTFVVDAAGSVVAFQPRPGFNTGAVVRFAPGAYKTEPICDACLQIELDGSGSLVALDAGGQLERFAPNSITPEPMDSYVASFAVDGAGFVIAETVMHLVQSYEPVFFLAQFAPGSDSGNVFASRIVSFALDKIGSVVALDSQGNLNRFAPGSTVAQPFDPNTAVGSFAIDGSGEVVALEAGGTLVRFIPGSAPGSFERKVMIASGPSYRGFQLRCRSQFLSHRPKRLRGC